MSIMNQETMLQDRLLCSLVWAMPAIVWFGVCRFLRHRRIKQLEHKYHVETMKIADAVVILKMTAELEDPLIFKMASAIGVLTVSAA